MFAAGDQFLTVSPEEFASRIRGRKGQVPRRATKREFERRRLADDLNDVRAYRFGQLRRGFARFFTVVLEFDRRFGKRLAELGTVYRDPTTKFGQLANEMWRAVRLVVERMADRYLELYTRLLGNS